MDSFADLQQRFADALCGPAGAAPGFAITGPAASSDPAFIERMDVYRRAMRANYHRALAATYPAVRRLVGPGVFGAAVDAYVREYPSTSGDLNDFGDDLGTFLAAYPAAAHLAYVPDIARLEWAIDEANRAADADVLPDAVLAALAAVPGDRLPRVTLQLAPSCRLIASAFPIYTIWQKAGSETTSPDDRGIVSDLDCAEGDRLIVRRDAGGIGVEHLAAGEFAWLDALAAGATLGTSIDAARRADPAFDLGRVLHAHIGAATIVGVAVAD